MRLKFFLEKNIVHLNAADCADQEVKRMLRTPI